MIDNIFVIKPNFSSFQGVLVTDIPDHLPIMHIDCKGLSLNNDDFIYRRNLPPTNKQAFRIAFATLYWDEIYHKTDMQMAFSRFHSMFLNLYNAHIPKRKIKVKYNTRKLWLTQGLKSSLNTKIKMYKLFLKVPFAHYETMNKAYRNKPNHTCILKKTEKQHYTDLLTANKRSLKNTWQIMRNLVNQNKVKMLIQNLD